MILKILKLKYENMKYFLKKLLDLQIFRSLFSWATNFFFERFVKPSSSPFYILNVRSLIFIHILEKAVNALLSANFVIETFNWKKNGLFTDKPKNTVFAEVLNYRLNHGDLIIRKGVKEKKW